MQVQPNDAIALNETEDNKLQEQYDALTPREKECAYWLFYGKTVPEIALILNVSKRTIEKFIVNIKEKFNCYTLFQLGVALAPIKDKLQTYYQIAATANPTTVGLRQPDAEGVK